MNNCRPCTLDNDENKFDVYFRWWPLSLRQAICHFRLYEPPPSRSTPLLRWLYWLKSNIYDYGTPIQSRCDQTSRTTWHDSWLMCDVRCTFTKPTQAFAVYCKGSHQSIAMSLFWMTLEIARKVPLATTESDGNKQTPRINQCRKLGNCGNGRHKAIRIIGARSWKSP